jgi:tetratricopeptide (TPR) repeat protein
MIANIVLAAALAAATPQQQPHDHAAGADTREATLMAGMGETHHAINTRNAEAQKFFDQGLTLVYGFNHDEAILSFKKAAALDPASPMPHWGIALALGPNINSDVDAAREKAAYDAVQQALRLARRANASEAAYVRALATRYSNDPKADLKALSVKYAEAMRGLAAAFPDDDDAVTLYAESLMDLRPWQLYSLDGTPAEGTLEIVNILERVLARSPKHVGANHYYIHATEASLSPERALPSAKRLETLVPAAGHLVHMPAHTYMRTGNYAGAVEVNVRAADVDRKYIEETNAGGFYPAMYYTHNLDFIASAAMMTGQYAVARKAADEVVANVRPMLADMAMLEPFAAKTLYVQLRFGKWDEVLAAPAPAATETLLTALHHYGRGVAHSMKGQLAEADAARTAFATARQAVPTDTIWGLNTAAGVLAVAASALDARIASARGDVDGAVQAWKNAIAAEDLLGYNEPSDWYYPTRESLGAVLLKAQRFLEAREVYRQDLERNPENPRSMQGLAQALAGTYPQDRNAQVLRGRAAKAWENADVDLNVTDY